MNFEEIHLSDFKTARENHQLEVKKAQGGLPESLWEAYSAFANTDGGIILLGVEEKKDYSLAPVGLSDAQKLLRDFFNLLNDPKKVSANILTNSMVKILRWDEKDIMVIAVPKATPSQKPVYIHSNLYSGTYLRGYEGDYHASIEEVNAMIRDKSPAARDLRPIVTFHLSSLNVDSIHSYRNRFRLERPSHVWNDLSDQDFLFRIGAIDHEKECHPTEAGLLFFGDDYNIIREFPNYFLDYEDHVSNEVNARWTDRLCSGSGEWSGNLYDFFFSVYNKLLKYLPLPFEDRDGLFRNDDNMLRQAVREALCNAITNADFSYPRGIVVSHYPTSISFENPGRSRIDLEKAIIGGVSDPRNPTILRFFGFINVGERAGTGIPLIEKATKTMHLPPVEIRESTAPNRHSLTMYLSETVDALQQKIMELDIEKSNAEKLAIYLNKIGDAPITRKAIMDELGVKETRASYILARLLDRGIIAKKKRGVYQLIKPN